MRRAIAVLAIALAVVLGCAPPGPPRSAPSGPASSSEAASPSPTRTGLPTEASSPIAATNNGLATCTPHTFPHPTDLALQFRPYDPASRAGARLGRAELDQLLADHAVTFIDLVVLTNLYRVRPTQSIDATFARLVADPRVFRVERVLVTDCAAS